MESCVGGGSGGCCCIVTVCVTVAVPVRSGPEREAVGAGWGGGGLLEKEEDVGAAGSVGTAPGCGGGGDVAEGC